MMDHQFLGEIASYYIIFFLLKYNFTLTSNLNHYPNGSINFTLSTTQLQLHSTRSGGMPCSGNVLAGDLCTYSNAFESQSI